MFYHCGRTILLCIFFEILCPIQERVYNADVPSSLNECSNLDNTHESSMPMHVESRLHCEKSGACATNRQ